MGLSEILSALPLFPDRVRYLRQTRKENCVQTVVAMALDVPTRLVEEEAGTDGRMTVRETFDLLGRLGISVRSVSADLAADFWHTFYRRFGGRSLRAMAFHLPRGREEVGHAYFLVGPQMYDPATGEKTRLDEAALRKLDWLAFFPEDLASNPDLESFRRALRGRR